MQKILIAIGFVTALLLGVIVVSLQKRSDSLMGAVSFDTSKSCPDQYYLPNYLPKTSPPLQITIPPIGTVPGNVITAFMQNGSVDPAVDSYKPDAFSAFQGGCPSSLQRFVPTCTGACVQEQYVDANGVSQQIPIQVKVIHADPNDIKNPKTWKILSEIGDIDQSINYFQSKNKNYNGGLDVITHVASGLPKVSTKDRATQFSIRGGEERGTPSGRSGNDAVYCLYIRPCSPP